MWFLVASLLRWSTVWATILVDVSQPAGARSSSANGIVRMLNVSRSRGKCFCFLCIDWKFLCSAVRNNVLNPFGVHILTWLTWSPFRRHRTTSPYNVSVPRHRVSVLKYLRRSGCHILIPLWSRPVTRFIRA